MGPMGPTGPNANIEAPQSLQELRKLAGHRRFHNTDPRREGFAKALRLCRPMAGAGVGG